MARLNHKTMLRKLLPSGLALMGPTFDKLIEALASEFSRIDELAVKFLEKEIPGDLEYQLEAWEKIVGLPDEFTSHLAPGNLEARNLAVVGKLSSVGGQSTEFWTTFLRRISSSKVEIKFFKPLRAGFTAGDYAFDEQWVFAFEVTNIKSSDLQLIKANVERFKQAHLAALFSEDN